MEAKNISKPFSSLPAESSNYGKQAVAGFASGQNTTATGTGGFLQAKNKCALSNNGEDVIFLGRKYSQKLRFRAKCNTDRDIAVC